MLSDTAESQSQGSEGSSCVFSFFYDTRKCLTLAYVRPHPTWPYRPTLCYKPNTLKVKCLCLASEELSSDSRPLNIMSLEETGGKAGTHMKIKKGATHWRANHVIGSTYKSSASEWPTTVGARP